MIFRGLCDETNKPNKKFIPLMRNEEIIEFPVDQSTLTGRLTDEAIGLWSHAEGAVFLSGASDAVHSIVCIRGIHGSKQGGLYGDVIEELDEATGRLLAALEGASVADNTCDFHIRQWALVSKGDAGGHALPCGAVKERFLKAECGFHVLCVGRDEFQLDLSVRRLPPHWIYCRVLHTNWA